MKLELSPKGMGIHQKMGGEMVIPGISFSNWKENLTLWQMDIHYYYLGCWACRKYHLLKIEVK